MILVYVQKGSSTLNKSMAKEVGNEKIVQTLPEIEFDRRMHPLFTDIPGLLCPLVSHKIACAAATFAAAPQVTGRRPHHTRTPDNVS